MTMRSAAFSCLAFSALAALVGADNPKPATTQATSPDLKVTTTTPGDPGAKNGDIILMLYTGKLADGTVFDSTENHGGKPFQFTLGQGRVIKGWDQGILGMTLGEKRKLVIPPDLAYGAAGSPPTIPANSTLTFDVELVGMVRVPPPPAQK
jgi:FKBP-type peptidyl-prolyl cis-trans isomerase